MRNSVAGFHAVEILEEAAKVVYILGNEVRCGSDEFAVRCDRNEFRTRGVQGAAR